MMKETCAMTGSSNIFCFLFVLKSIKQMNKVLEDGFPGEQ